VITREVVFRDRYGLHPRAARRIRESLSGLQAKVTLQSLDGAGASVDAGGMLALISSGIQAGERIRIEADGTDEAAAAKALGDLLESGVCHPMIGR